MLTRPIPELAKARRWKSRDVLAEQLAALGGRIELYHDMKRHSTERFVLGFDSAAGIEGRDYDAMVGLLIDTNPMIQVCEAHGHWGERFDRVTTPLARYFNDAFVCGETQGGGLATLRRMYSPMEWGYGHLYMQREEKNRPRRPTDRLGYTKSRSGTEDLALKNLQAAIREKTLLLRSATLVDQISKLQWRARDGKDPEEASDSDLVVKLAGGGSPDLVMALAYALHAAREYPVEETKRQKYAEGTAGAILGHEDDDEEPEEPSRRGRR